MKKFIAVFAFVILLLPSVSSAAWAYKGVPIKPGTDAEIAAQLAAIDAGTPVPESPSIQEQVALLVAQIEALQAQLAALQTLGGGTIGNMPPEEEEVTPEPVNENQQEIDSLVADLMGVDSQLDEYWSESGLLKCLAGSKCDSLVRERNEITKKLNELGERGYNSYRGCTYEFVPMQASKRGWKATTCGG